MVKMKAPMPTMIEAAIEPTKSQASNADKPPVAAEPNSRPSVERSRPPTMKTATMTKGLNGSISFRKPGLRQCSGSGAGSFSPSITRIIRLTPAEMPPAKSPVLNFGVMSSSMMRLVVASVSAPSRP